MWEDKVFSAYYVATVLDYTFDLAKVKMALIENHVPHIFCIANDNGFSFQTEVMGMRPNGTVTCTMAIKHPPSNSEITTMLDINTLISIDIQMFTELTTLTYGNFCVTLIDVTPNPCRGTMSFLKCCVDSNVNKK